MKILLILLLLLLLLNGICFADEPEIIDYRLPMDNNSDMSIEGSSILKNMLSITKDGVVKISCPDGYALEATIWSPSIKLTTPKQKNLPKIMDIKGISEPLTDAEIKCVQVGVVWRDVEVDCTYHCCSYEGNGKIIQLGLVGSKECK